MRSKMATTEAEFLHLDESEVGVAFLADSFLIQFTWHYFIFLNSFKTIVINISYIITVLCKW